MKANRKKINRIALTISLGTAVLALVAACIAVFSIRENTSSPQIEVSSGDAASRTDAAENMEEVVPATEYIYNGIVRTLANGDSFYTPGEDHAVADADRTVTYYNNLLVAFTEKDLSNEEIDALCLGIDGQVVGVVSGSIHAVQIMVPESSLTELEVLADVLMKTPQVIYSCAEYPVQIMGTKADDNPWNIDGYEEFRGDELNPGGTDWWAEAIGAYTAWEYADMCQEVRVGIVDNGFYAEHEDLTGQITFISNDDCNTAADHGTLVAGIIAARNNDVGIRGVADTAKLYCADVWPTDDYDSYHTLTEYLAVINYMEQSGVKAVNNSWGCLLPSEKTYLENAQEDFGQTHDSDDYRQWLDQRLNRDLAATAEACIVMIGQLISSGNEDMLMVHAAGNGTDNGGAGVDARYCGFFSCVTESTFNSMDVSILEWFADAGISYKDIDERIMVVGSVSCDRDATGNYYMSCFSNYGETVDICAPGDIVYSTTTPYFGISYGAYGGTSLSAPMVTGSAAFLWSLDPNLTAAQIHQILLDSAQVRAVGTGSSEGWSYPMLNIGAASQTVVENIESEA